MPFSKAPSTPRWRIRETHPDRCYRPSDVPAVEDPSGNPTCTALLPETHGAKSLQICPATRCPLLLRSSLPPSPPSSSPLPVPPVGRAPSPAALCRGAAPGQSCLSAVLPACQELPLGPGARPSSAAQHRTMASLSLCHWTPSRCPQGLRADSSRRQQGLSWGVVFEAD